MNTDISTKELTLDPSGEGTTFDVVVINDSQFMSSFQLEISAAGVESDRQWLWYQVTPEVCSKKPPGDQTKFQVKVLRSPIPGFVGLVNLTVKVFSLELGKEERHILRLNVMQGLGECPFRVELPTSHIQTLPNNEVEILVGIHNNSQKAIALILSVISPKREWLLLDNQTPLNLPPQQSQNYSFTCKVPEILQALAGVYPFTIRCVSANHNSPVGAGSSLSQLNARTTTEASCTGSIEVLPTGTLEFDAFPKQQRQPALRPWLPQWGIDPAVYQLEFTNNSNYPQGGTVEIINNPQTQDPIINEFSIIPEQVSLEPGEIQTVELLAYSKRPWWGLGRTQTIEVGWEGKVGAGSLAVRPTGELTDPLQRLETKISPRVGGIDELTTTRPSEDYGSDSEHPQPLPILELRLLPIIPRWLQVAIALLILGGIWWFLYAAFRLNYHTAPVNVVRFNGLGDMAISTSNDQTLRGWRVQGNRLRHNGWLRNLGKAGRTGLYRPVDNDQVAVGLENGEIQIWDLLRSTDSPRRSLSYRRDDRVMALAYSQNSQYLFSAHGSGLILQWYVGPTVNLTNVEEPQLIQEFDFAIYDIAPVGPRQETLAIAGRYNQLVLWDTTGGNEGLRTVPYPAGGQDEYITSLATAADQPFLLATADDRGSISLWNLRECLTNQSATCQIIDQWQAHGGQPIRSLALTANGCYLASTGDDGEVMLWPLQRSGERSTQHLAGEAIARSRYPKNSLDMIAIGSYLHMITGSRDHQVNLHRIQQPATLCN
ncbi:MAG: hypothetical protein P5681_02680 [Limnospira sp. PMC 894.15]|uniref:Uncharacterized protein n=1 Tax=Limnospira fusiformis PMC 851.14 TaxID=2219512 RepID=A0ABU9EQK1_LIMFS|nr:MULTISPECIES: hypothetical protein [Limnospira]MDT9186711.1 hypothetical protein [Limnospira sp. PMC 894.15]MDT9232660.1 hypothetical protein [Limnospira sp. PMC 917.15]QNH59636.1 MAG: hypothetical protein H2674_10935 [Limnospira indica BM01]